MMPPNRLLFLAALALLMLNPPPAVADDKAPAPEGDLARFQGQWSGKFGPGDGVPLVVTFKGNAVTVRTTDPDGDAIEVKGEVRLDETSKPHKAIDWLKFTTNNGDALPDRQGIYAFEDADTLKTNTAASDSGRPSGFEGAGAGAIALVLKRDKDAQAGDCLAPPDDAPRGDLARFQGTWSTKLGPEKTLPALITVKGTAVTLKLTSPGGEAFVTTGALKLDESARPHKTIDWVKFTGPTGDAIPENLGLYEFADADTLRVCNGGPGGQRPTEFKAGDAGFPQILTLRREASNDDPEAVKGDLAKLQGDWTAKVGPNKDIPMSLAVKGRTVAVHFTTPDGADREMKGEVALDERAKPHKTIDWVKFSLPDGGDAPANLSIYTLDGDTFTVCLGGLGNDRPTEFKAGEGGPPNLYVFTRKAK